MKDRARYNNGKSSKLMCPSSYNPASFAAFLADLKAGTVYVDVTANNSNGADAGVSEVGTPLNKSNLLSDATALKFGYSNSDNPTPNDVFSKIGGLNSTTEVELLSSGWTQSGSLYTQQKQVTGVTTAVEPNIKGLIYPSNCDDSTRRAIQRSASYITNIATGNGTLTFTATARPTVNVKFGVGV